MAADSGKGASEEVGLGTEARIGAPSMVDFPVDYYFPPLFGSISRGNLSGPGRRTARCLDLFAQHQLPCTRADGTEMR